MIYIKHVTDALIAVDTIASSINAFAFIDSIAVTESIITFPVYYRFIDQEYIIDGRRLTWGIKNSEFLDELLIEERTRRRLSPKTVIDSPSITETIVEGILIVTEEFLEPFEVFTVNLAIRNFQYIDSLTLQETMSVY